MDEKIKVTDKRMFTAEGELRDGYRNEEAASADETSEAETAEPVASPETAQPETSTPAQAEPPPRAMPDGSTAATEDLPAPTFVDLIGLLAQPIAMFLGDAAMPGGEPEENLPLARFHIDLLELIQVKTQGNTTPEESRLLEDLLYQLRMRYVEKAG